jgi:hypothetical protein
MTCLVMMPALPKYPAVSQSFCDAFRAEAYQLFSASVTVGAPLASVVRQSRRPRF